MLTVQLLPFPERSTQRLLLRRLSPADAPGIFAIRSNPEVMRYINRPVMQSLAEAEQWLAMVEENLVKNEGISWAVCRKEEPQTVVGTVALWRIDKENHRAEIGYNLHADWQGKGLMSEAVPPVIEYGFAHMKLHTIEAQLDPRNEASAALARKAGFVQEALFRQNCWLHDAFADTAVYSLLTPYQ